MRTIQFCVWLFLAASITSCSVKKRMLAVRDSLINMRAGASDDSLKISGLGEKSETKLKEGKIDSVLGYRIKSRLKVFEDSFFYYRNLSDSLYSLLGDRKKFKKHYRSHVIPLLDSLKSNYERHRGRLTLYLLIEDGLNIADYHLYEMAAFFGPGKYTIPLEKLDSALLAFGPLMDSLIAFSDKYKGHKRVASLVILGFADATGFNDKSQLTDTLMSLMGSKNATREQLNRKLSELRAEEVCRQLARLFYIKSASAKNISELRLEYNYMGKGEVFPFPHIKDYTASDPRRRIVLCYWSILPE